MGVGFDRKLATLAGLSALAGTAAVGGLAFWISSGALRDNLHKQARTASQQIATRVSEELASVVERSRHYAADGSNAADSRNKAFEADGQLLALSVLSKPFASDQTDWAPLRQWLLPEDAPARLTAKDFEELNLKYPIDTDRITRGENDVLFASSGSVPALIRVAVPYGEKSVDGFTQALVAEVKILRIEALFRHREGIFAFMTSPREALVIASDSGHFGPAEDLSKLAITQAARVTPETLGSLDYRETTEGETQYAAFARVPDAPGLTIYAQAPHSRLASALDPLLQSIAAAGVAFALLFGLLIWWYSARWSWSRQRDVEHEAGTAPASAQVSPPSTPFTKVADPAFRQALEQGKHKHSGERFEAAVLHAHLHGVDRLSSQADPETFLKLLNTFHQKAVHAVESRQGIVDHMHGGSVVALWSVPRVQEDDVTRAIEAASEISLAAHELNEALQAASLAPCRLGMGLHHGPITIGQIGVAGRIEYSAVGEALEVAARIQQFTDQFGTDFLMTGPAAKRTGEDFPTEQVTAGDEGTPELYELADEEEAEEDALPAA